MTRREEPHKVTTPTSDPKTSPWQGLTCAQIQPGTEHWSPLSGKPHNDIDKLNGPTGHPVTPNRPRVSGPTNG